MTYYQFIRAVEGKVKEGVKENITVQLYTAVKNNGIKKYGLTIMEKGINISPTIYLEEYYQQFCDGDSVEEITEEILSLYQRIRFRHSWDGSLVEEYAKVKEKIVYRLINRQANRELLEGVPHQNFLDLAVIYQVLLEVSFYGTASMLISDEHLKMWNVKEAEIFARAAWNTRRILPEDCQPLSEMAGGWGVEIPRGEDIFYVLTNRYRNFGAACLLYEGCLERIGEKLGENYYVLPSSVHEVIILPESKSVSKRDLTALVREVNDTQVEEEEILSDRVYYYDREYKLLRI